MYFADLTEYRYGQTSPRPNVLNVGWLSNASAFQQGNVSSEFIINLKRLVASPINLYRGAHFCEFCSPSPLSKEDILKFVPVPGTAGNGEIRVRGIGVKN